MTEKQRQKINEEKEKQKQIEMQSKEEDVRAQELVLCDNPGCEKLIFTVSNVRRKHVATVQVHTYSKSQRKVTIW